MIHWIIKFYDSKIICKQIIYIDDYFFFEPLISNAYKKVINNFLQFKNILPNKHFNLYF